MLTLVKLLQSLVKALHSEGTPGQLAAGIALGSILGLTPLVSLHNAIVFGLIVMLNVSFPGAMLGWAVFIPVGFLLDPLFDHIGHVLLLHIAALTPLWTSLYNMPVVPLTNFNNTVTLGSLVFSAAFFLPLFFAARWAVTRYRATIGERVRQSKWYRALTASKLYNVYRLFKPEP
ncbi:MAG TPA: TIGR03546 family protein [Gemmatimonadales bacterium]|nr:TIGR03546 family protein [Gemmatimonadales bacterium]